MKNPRVSWREVKVEVSTVSTVPVPIYPQLAQLWIGEAARHGVEAVKTGRWPATRTPDYASHMGEYIALLQIGEELVVLSLSHFNAVQCNVSRRTLQARALEPGDDLRKIFAYVSTT